MPSTSRDPYLLIELCDDTTVHGRPVYKVTKHVPAEGGNPATTLIIRCIDLGREALGNYKAEEGGCSQYLFFNETKDLRCAKCGMDFSKSYLGKDLYLEVKGIPD